MHFNVALILLYDKAGRVLLQHRTEDAPVLPGYWAFFGGRLKSTETALEAMHREAGEELDYTPRFPRLLLEHKFREGGSHGCLYVFCEFYGGIPSALKLREGQGWGWFNAQETLSLKMAQRDRAILTVLWEEIQGTRHKE